MTRGVARDRHLLLPPHHPVPCHWRAARPLGVGLKRLASSPGGNGASLLRARDTVAARTTARIRRDAARNVARNVETSRVALHPPRVSRVSRVSHVASGSSSHPSRGRVGGFSRAEADALSPRREADARDSSSRDFGDSERVRSTTRDRVSDQRESSLCSDRCSLSSRAASARLRARLRSAAVRSARFASASAAAMTVPFVRRARSYASFLRDTSAKRRGVIVGDIVGDASDASSSEDASDPSR